MIFDSCTLTWHTGQLTIRAEEEDEVEEEEEELEEEVMEVEVEEYGVRAGKEEVKDEEVAEDEEGETVVAAPGRTEGDSVFAEPPLDVLWKKS